LRHHQVKYIRDWGLDKDLFTNGEKEQKWTSELYPDSYMDQSPFSGVVWKAKYEDDLIDDDSEDDENVVDKQK
jgi:hypothetical protein